MARHGGARRGKARQAIKHEDVFMKVFEWRNSPVDLKINPEVAFNELERIRADHGGELIPKTVVLESKPVTAPLHPVFEWRNAVAADRYREWQARNVIKAVRIVVIDETGEKVSEPAFVSVRVVAEDGKLSRYYQQTDVAITRPDEWMSAIAQAQLKLNAAEQAIKDLQRIAAQSQDPDRMQRLSIAAMAMRTAQDALRVH
jgi:hypothetical protein